MDFEIKNEQGFQYVEQGQGPVLLLLHGLFGALSNFEEVIDYFSDKYRVIIPLMPIYTKSKHGASVDGLSEFVHNFVTFKGLDDMIVLGNSLGGHTGLIYTLAHPQKVKLLVLTGSSGLYETGLGSGFPKRSSYEYIQERVGYTFYSQETATKELVDEVFDILNDNFKTLRILRIARSAQRHYMGSEIVNIEVPTLLIWGLNDNITPPRVAHEFAKLLPNSELHFIDKCGHAAMMEQPALFNEILAKFLDKHLQAVAQ
ncbi:alpha/beta hydrolase [Pontibacter sp. G13]|uniref:alpha/beta fold hydrolase n=1 Tax=Pontibacter sp. G13 TaxID=3074898 RepID=UPI00288B225D|nr:alpha/beta hydrolase [Pontibacter sp. G13]WNJ16495.1 alpha/beta hydrolase [Pontibacter sp. G13]